MWTIGRVRNCFDAHLGQIVCDKDGVVDWCIVLVEMPLTNLKSAALFQRNLFLNSLKAQHINHNPHPLVNQLWCSDFLTPPTPVIIPHCLPAFLESLMPLKSCCSIHARWSKSSLKYYIRFSGIFFEV